MTEKEYKILCKLIDLRTTTKCGQFDDYKEITAKDIDNLKQDIKETLVDKTKASTVEEINKEWEELGYKVYYNDAYIYFVNKIKTIAIFKVHNAYSYTCYSNDATK